MQLTRPKGRRQVTMVTKAGRVVTTETHIMWKNKNKKNTRKLSKHFQICLMWFWDVINSKNIAKIIILRIIRSKFGTKSFIFSTSGSPESRLVWMRILPMRTSLHTALRAGSMVSPARRIDTPVICWDRAAEQAWWQKPWGHTQQEVEKTLQKKSITHPLPVVTAALILMSLWSLNYTRLLKYRKEFVL